jgi:Flp pilus assembly protein TadD
MARRAGGIPPDRSHWTVAWELYGAGLPFDQFLIRQGQRFHSMLDVLAFDPARAATHVAGNLARHRLQEVRELVPPWMGVLAVPGLVLLPRSRATGLWFAHAVACAAVLALVFYNPRFGLYLAPLLVAAAGATLRAIATRWPASRNVVAGVGALLLAANLFVAIRETRAHLGAAPHETRVLGSMLAREPRTTAARADLGVMARKPHAAWFAGRRFVPLPANGSLRDLRDAARSTGAAYLVFTPIEQEQRPQYSLLADSGLVLPGFRQLDWIRLPKGGAALYRFTDETVDPAAFDAAHERALREHVRHLPGDAAAVHEVALQLAQLRHYDEALALIEKLRAQGARDGRIEELRSSLYFELGALDSSEAACREAMRLMPPTGWHWARLGTIQAREQRWNEAQRSYQLALGFEPTNLEYLAGYSYSQAAAGDTRGAAATLERALYLAPDNAGIRQLAIEMLSRSGETARAQALLEDGLRRGIPRERLLPRGP